MKLKFKKSKSKKSFLHLFPTEMYNTNSPSTNNQFYSRDYLLFKQVKKKSKLKKFRKILSHLFPTVMHCANFIFLILLILVSLSTNDPLISLISILGAIYCLNEWWRKD